MRAILALLSLAACASPAPEFFGAARYEVVKGGIKFVVLQNGSRAEAIRMGYLTRAQRGPVPGLMVEAVEEVTGCKVLPATIVTGLPGDTGEFRMDLACG